MNSLTRKFPLTLLAICVATSLAASNQAVHADTGISGRVAGQSEQGKYLGMVGDATIEIIKPGGDLVATTTSNRQGRFKLSLPPGRYYYRVQADGYQDEDAGRGFEIRRSDQMEIFHFALTKGESPTVRVPAIIPEPTHGTLRGRVLEELADRDVVGIRFATVTLVHEATREVQRARARPGGDVGGRDYGEFDISLPTGTWRASVRAPGFATLVDPEPIEIEVGETVGRTFKLRRFDPPTEMIARQGIRGEVLIEKAGRTYPPPFAATLRVLNPRTRMVIDTKTTQIGESEFRFDTPPGTYQVVASEPDGEFAKAVSAPLYVFAGRHSTARLVMRPRPTVPEASEPPELEIVAVDRRTKQPLVETEILLREVSDRKATVIRGLTDREGIARFKVTAGRYFVIARLAGFEVVGATPQSSFVRGRLVLNIEPKKRHRATFLLDRHRDTPRARGLVIEAEDEKAGRPVVGAIVGITRAMRPPRVLTTNANGEVNVPEAAVGRYSIQITHPDYMTVTREIEFDPAEPRHHFAMYRRPTYTDRDFTASGSVMFQSETGLGTAMIPHAEVIWVGPNTVSDTADDLGRYRVGVLRGSYNVTVTPPANSGYVTRTFSDIDVAGDLTQNFVLGRRPDIPPISPQVQVNVFNERTRSPIPGAWVMLQRAGSGGATAASGNTATNGQVTLPLSTPGSYLANVSAAGYVARRIEVTATAGRIAVVNAAMRRSDEPIVPGGPSAMTVSGWVVTNRYASMRPSTRLLPGQPPKSSESPPDWGRVEPVANAEVLWYFPNEGALPGAVRLVRTNAKGRFTVDNIPENRYTVSVRATGFEDQTQRVSVRETMRDPVFVMKRADRVQPVEPVQPITVQGWVVTKKSSSIGPRKTPSTFRGTPDWNQFQPVPGADVSWRGPPQGRLPGPMGLVRSDGKGRFQIDNLSTNLYTLTTRANGYNETVSRVNVAPGLADPIVYLSPSGTIAPTDPNASKSFVKLTVLTRDQPPAFVSNAQIDIKGNRGSASGTSDQSGRFTTQLAPGQYTVAISHGNYQTASQSLTVGSRAVNQVIYLSPRGTVTPGGVNPDATDRQLSLTVVDQQKRRVPKATVQVFARQRFPMSRMTKPLRSGATSTAGTYQTGIRPGLYTVRVSGSGFQTATASVAITRSDVSKTIQVIRRSIGPITPGAITPGVQNRQLTVQVLDQTRKGVGGVTVTIMKGNAAVRAGQTNPSGRYMATVAADTYFVKATGPMIHPGGTQVNVQNNTTATVNVTRTSDSAASQGGRTMIKYLAQYRAPGTRTWTTIGAYNDRRTAEAALKRAKMPVKSQTRVVPQTRAATRGIQIPRSFPVETRR